MMTWTLWLALPSLQNVCSSPNPPCFSGDVKQATKKPAVK